MTYGCCVYVYNMYGDHRTISEIELWVIAYVDSYSYITSRAQVHCSIWQIEQWTYVRRGEKRVVQQSKM